MFCWWPQVLVSRETSPLGSAVLSVTLLKAGEAYNVIPDEVCVCGGVCVHVYEVRCVHGVVCAVHGMSGAS